MYYSGLDATDNKILNLLIDDARLSYSDIATEVNISRVAVKNRIKAMEEKGVIQGYKTIVNNANAYDGVDFMLDIETAPNCCAGVMHILGKKEMIHRLYSLSGDCKIHAEGRVGNTKELSVFTRQLYNNDTYGIKKISFNVILDTLKDIDGGVEYEEYRRKQEQTGA